MRLRTAIPGVLDITGNVRDGSFEAWAMIVAQSSDPLCGTVIASVREGLRIIDF